MKVFTTSERPLSYDGLAEKIVVEARSCLGSSALRFLEKVILGYGPPVLLFDIYNSQGKLKIIKIILPVGTRSQIKKDHDSLVSIIERKKIARLK